MAPSQWKTLHCNIVSHWLGAYIKWSLDQGQPQYTFMSLYMFIWSLCIDGLMQERRNSIANTLELRLSCTNPSICTIHPNNYAEGYADVPESQNPPPPPQKKKKKKNLAISRYKYWLTDNQSLSDFFAVSLFINFLYQILTLKKKGLVVTFCLSQLFTSCL